MERIGICLLDGYAMMSAAAAQEPLRAANLFSPVKLYDVVCLSLEATTASSSLPASFHTVPIAEAGYDFDIVFVVAGGDISRVGSRQLTDWLRRLDRKGVRLGGISGGAGPLADAGLLEGRRFTIHWHHLDDLRAKHPNALIERRLFVLDRDRFTCAGGTAPLDMMHALIASKHGSAFAQKISDWFIQTEVRASGAPQLAGVEARYGTLPKPVAEAIELMESHLADPLSIDQVSSLVGVSARQLQRQFNAALGQTPAECYRDIRLAKSRELAQNSAHSAKVIAEITGFASGSSFATAYAAKFGETFRQTRAANKAVCHPE